MTDAVKLGITIEDLMQANVHKQVEVVDGVFVEVNMAAAGILHVFVGATVYDILKPFIKKHDLGTLLTDGLTYVLHVDEHGVRTSRIPDLSFLRKGRLSGVIDLVTPFNGAPDLAIEVISPSESSADIQDKIDDLLTYGTEEVWVLYPSNKKVYQYRRDDLKMVRIYSNNDQLECESLFPGLVVSVDQFFVMPE